jgi:hypothetical protein
VKVQYYELNILFGFNVQYSSLHGLCRDKNNEFLSMILNVICGISHRGNVKCDNQLSYKPGLASRMLLSARFERRTMSALSFLLSAAPLPEAEGPIH